MPVNRLLVLDFDGTVCLGDEPVLSYARHLDEALAVSDPAHASTIIVDTVARFLQGPDAAARAGAGVARAGNGADDTPDDIAADIAADLATELAEVVGSADGYAAAMTLARSRGIEPGALSSAYEASRAELAAGLLRTWAPGGLREFLDGMREDATPVLVTNATATGLDSQLEHLGLTGAFDEIVASADKPTGMPDVLHRLRREHGLGEAPERLLSVGDIWRNDLAPAAAQGSPTALIERFADPDANPTYRAATFEELYPQLSEWARQA